MAKNALNGISEIMWSVIERPLLLTTPDGIYVVNAMSIYQMAYINFNFLGNVLDIEKEFSEFNDPIPRAIDMLKKFDIMYKLLITTEGEDFCVTESVEKAVKYFERMRDNDMLELHPDLVEIIINEARYNNKLGHVLNINTSLAKPALEFVDVPNNLQEYLGIVD